MVGVEASFPMRSLERLCLGTLRRTRPCRQRPRMHERRSWATREDASGRYFDAFSPSGDVSEAFPDSCTFAVETMGLEPTTPCLQSRCSSQLSYVPEFGRRPTVSCGL